MRTFKKKSLWLQWKEETSSTYIEKWKLLEKTYVTVTQGSLLWEMKTSNLVWKIKDLQGFYAKEEALQVSCENQRTFRYSRKKKRKVPNIFYAKISLSSPGRKKGTWLPWGYNSFRSSIKWDDFHILYKKKRKKNMLSVIIRQDLQVLIRSTLRGSP